MASQIGNELSSERPSVGVLNRYIFFIDMDSAQRGI